MELGVLPEILVVHHSLDSKHLVTGPAYIITAHC